MSKMISHPRNCTYLVLQRPCFSWMIGGLIATSCHITSFNPIYQFSHYATFKKEITLASRPFQQIAHCRNAEGCVITPLLLCTRNTSLTFWQANEASLAHLKRKKSSWNSFIEHIGFQVFLHLTLKAPFNTFLVSDVTGTQSPSVHSHSF